MKKGIYQEISIEKLVRGKFQPRTLFDPTHIELLADSIRQIGIKQDLLVRPLNKEQGTYEIVCGECRWRAAGKAELQTVPCRIEALTDEEAATIALTENMRRKNLNPIDEARGYYTLHEVFHIPQKVIAQQVGVSTPHMSNMLRLLTLPEKLQRLVKEGKIKKASAKLLVSLPEDEQGKWGLLAQTMPSHLFERKLQVERKNKKNKSITLNANTPDADILSLERKYSEYIGSPTKFTKKENKFIATIIFHDLDVFEGFLIKSGYRKQEVSFG